MYKHVVVAVDGSAPSRRAFDHAVELARAVGARLTLVATVDAEAALPLETYGVTPMHFVEKEEKRMADTLAALKAGVQGLSVEVMVVHGEPAEQICEAARRCGGDVVVVGSRGLRALGRLLLGSVSSRVAQSCEVSVLIVR